MPIEAHERSRRVLVVDDDADVRGLVSESLTTHGFRVQEADSAARARTCISASRPDLVVLDLTLPDGSGLDILRELSLRPEIPVIILSGRSEDADRVAGLELGADDYVTKPFVSRELVARVNAVLRRTDQRPAPDQSMEFGPLVIDAAAKQARLDGRDIGLTAREFALLEFLASSPRTVFSSAQLLEHVWGSRVEWQSAKTVGEHVHRLRAKLESDPGRPRWIVTMKGAGYRFEPGTSPT